MRRHHRNRIGNSRGGSDGNEDLREHSVRDLDRSKAFFQQLGFAFNPQLTDEMAACMVITDAIYVMLLTQPKFKEFTKKDIADAHKTTEVLTCLSFDSKEKSARSSTRPLPPAARRHASRRTTALCLVEASMTSTAIFGRSSGWTRATSIAPDGPIKSAQSAPK